MHVKALPITCIAFPLQTLPTVPFPFPFPSRRLAAVALGAEGGRAPLPLLRFKVIRAHRNAFQFKSAHLEAKERTGSRIAGLRRDFWGVFVKNDMEGWDVVLYMDGRMLGRLLLRRASLFIIFFGPWPIFMWAFRYAGRGSHCGCGEDFRSASASGTGTDPKRGICMQNRFPSRRRAAFFIHSCDAVNFANKFSGCDFPLASSVLRRAVSRAMGDDGGPGGPRHQCGFFLG